MNPTNLLRAAVAAAVALPLLACGSPLPEGDVPAELVGSWYDGTFSPTEFWDEGSYEGNAYEQYMALEIDENGTYHQYVYNGTNYYGCDLRTWSLFEGAAFVEGDDIHFVPSRGEYQVRSNCYEDSNYNRDATSDEVAEMEDTYIWALVDGPIFEMWKADWGDDKFTLEPL
jgi:hypothetical protein